MLVLLDSNHTHAHVLAELEAYAQLVSVGSYCIVFDTVIEDLPGDAFSDRPWSKGNNAKRRCGNTSSAVPNLRSTSISSISC